MVKTIKGAIFKHGLGFILIFIGLWFLRSFALNTENPFLIGFTKFYMANIGLMIVITILHFLADVFKTFSLPLNLPYPIFKAFAVSAGVIFLFSLVEAAISQMSLKLALFVSSFGVYAYRIVFIITLIFSIFGLFKKKKEKVIVKRKFIKEKRSRYDHNKGSYKQKHSLKDVNNDFTEIIYLIVHNIKKMFEKKGEK